MARPSGSIPISPSGEVFIADCKGTVFLFDKVVNQFMPLGIHHLCRVMLYQDGDKTFRLVARTESSDSEVLLKLTLNHTMEYLVISEQWHQLKVDDLRQYGFNFLMECNPRNFAVVLQSLLKAAQAIAPPPVPPPYFEFNMSGMHPSRSQYARHMPEIFPSLPGANMPRMDIGARRKVLPHGLGQRKGPDDILALLMESISNGDQKTSIQLVQDLAARKSRLIICEAKRGIRNPTDLNKDLSLSVQVEDKDSSGASFKLKATPATTVGELKQMVFKKYNLPCEVQKWIIGKKITKNEDTLVKLNVTSSGATVFLYLMSAKDVGYKHPPYHGSAELTQKRTSGSSSSQSASILSNVQSQEYVASPADSQASGSSSGYGSSSSTPTLQQSSGSNERSVRSDVEPIVSEDELEAKVEKQGWTCPVCTFINPATRPGCVMCSHDRPAEFIVPQDYVVEEESERERMRLEEMGERLYHEAEEEARLQAQLNYEEMIELARQMLITNKEEFDCPICFMPVEVGEGVTLRDCLHCFCKDCLVETIRNSEEAEVQCPYQDDVIACHSVITGQEVKALLSPEDFERFLRRSLSTAESQAANSFHCKSANCPGWCFYEDNVNTFNCDVCGQPNCLTCKVQHPDMDCKEYQEDLKRRANNDEAAQQTQQFLEDMITKGDALRCPQCEIILLKKDGCDWMRCSMCKLEICWATRGPRWGPKGNGDISGGCRCRVGGKKCHPKCHNCH